MREFMYDQSSVLIASILLVTMITVIEAGYRVGFKARITESSRAHISAIQASLLGVLALLLGFTFSLSLQRYDSRSMAVVDEANAIGTAYLRSQLLPVRVRGDAQALLRSYLDLRIRTSALTLVSQAERQSLIAEAGRKEDELWRLARRAAELDGRPVTTGLFIESLNELIDSNGRRDAALKRHVPEVVLLLLYVTFLMTGSIVGYASGLVGHRASFVTYTMVILIVLLVFIIIDLDRPRRGLIEVDQSSLTDLQAMIAADPIAEGKTRHPQGAQ